MKQIILPSTILEFTQLVIYGFMEENGLAPPLPKRKLGPPNTEGPQEIWNLPSPYLQDMKKTISPPQKNICG